MSNETNWDNFRVDEMSLTTFVKRAAIHLDLLRAVLRRSSGGILEIGIGSGAQSALLSRLVSPVVSVDNDARILRTASVNLQRFGPETLLVQSDAFSLPFRDACFSVGLSQGLMEHFSDDAFAKLLREQLRVCRSVVFSVPSDHYPRQDVGDERLMSPGEWEQRTQKAVNLGRWRVKARYCRTDLERLKYSLKARRALGGFAVIVTIDPIRSKGARG